MGLGSHAYRKAVFSPVSGFQPSSRGQKHTAREGGREGGWGHKPQKLAIGHPRGEVPLSANAHHEPQTWQRGDSLSMASVCQLERVKPVADGALYMRHRKYIF